MLIRVGAHKFDWEAGLDPFLEGQPPFESFNSLGLRYQDEVVGWIITKRAAPGIIRYDRLFVQQQFRKTARAVALLAESIRRQWEYEGHLPGRGGVWRTNAGNAPMARFIKRRLGPYLTSMTETRSDSTDLRVSASVRIPDFFVEPCIRTVLRNFRHTCDDDLARQISLIRDSFAFHAAPDDGARRRSRCLQVSGTFLPQERLTPPERNSSEMLLHAAADIGQRLRQAAIPTASGCLNWVFPEETVAGDGAIYRFQPCDSFLYQGYSGIALFLAALSRIWPESGYAEDARAALLPLEAWLQEPYCPSGIGIGAAHGLGSIVYALTRISEWLDASDLLAQAGQIAEFITRKRIQSDKRFDLFDGAAGAIVGLLALHAMADEPGVLDRAIMCGDWLLTRRVETESGLRAWSTIRAKPVAGLSHGIAGIAYALLRLHQATGQKTFLQAAEEGMAFERTFFSAEHGNWRAFDSSAEEPDLWTTYCHGAPGIGLARLGGLPALDTPEIRDEIEIAMRAACCGNFGRIEALFTCWSACCWAAPFNWRCRFCRKCWWMWASASAICIS
jgi:lantibiotic modifying enzyme